VLQRKELEVEGLKVYSEMQKQATEGLFRELEITIEQGRPDCSVGEGTPQADLSERIVRLSLNSAL
jgi:hypothetical protein